MSKEMMICPIEGYCPQMGGSKCIWQQPHNENGACIIGHNTPSCPACIPYIPEQEYECTKGHTVPLGIKTCANEDCKDYASDSVLCYYLQPKKPVCVPHIIKEGSRQHVISYDSQGRHCSEPNCEINFEDKFPSNEPTCSECGHKVADHSDEGCMADIRCDGALNTCGCSITRDALNQMAEHNLIQTKTQCEHEWHPITQGTWNCTKCGEPYYDTPADLQPETIDEMSQYLRQTCVYRDTCVSTMLCRNCGVFMAEPVKPEPEMPLDDEICAIFSQYAEELSEELREKVGMQISTAVTARLQAHDSAVASKAIAQFAQQIIQGIEKLIADSREVEMASDEGKNCRSAYEQGLNEALAHIRAMAEGEE